MKKKDKHNIRNINNSCNCRNNNICKDKRRKTRRSSKSVYIINKQSEV